MIQRLQIQEDQFGEAINLTPRTLVVPVGYGFTLQTIFGSPTIQTTENTQAVNRCTITATPSKSSRTPP